MLLRIHLSYSTFSCEQEASELELKQNKVEVSKSFGTALVFGQVVQFFHVKSGKYLTTKKKLPAMMEKNAIQLVLEKNGSGGSWFTIMPYYKLKAEGEPVQVGDKVSFVAVKTGGDHLLRVSTMRYASDNLREINVSTSTTTKWRISRLVSYQDWNDSSIRSGDVLRLYHVEHESFLTFSPGRGSESFIPPTKVSRDDDNTCENLWELQVLKMGEKDGPAAHWGEGVRLRQLTTGLFLAVQKPPENAKKALKGNIVTAVKDNTGEETIFKLLLVKTAARQSEKSALGGYTKIFHPQTGTYLQTAVTLTCDRSDKADSFYRVSAQQTVEDRDTFDIVKLDRVLLRDIDMVSGIYNAISRLVHLLKELPYEPNEYETARPLRLLHESLQQSVVFVLDLADGDDSMVGFPNEQKQRIVREWKIFDVVFELLRCPFRDSNPSGGFISLCDLQKPQHQLLQRMCQLAYKVLPPSLPCFSLPLRIFKYHHQFRSLSVLP